MIKHLSKLLRWKEWGHSKIPLLFAAGSSWLLTQPPQLSASHALLLFVVWVLSVALFLAYGYALNDYCDQAADRISGKANAIGILGPRSGFLILLVLVGAGLGMLSPFLEKHWVAIFIGLCYVVGSFYSLPPLRFKERGIVGVLASAVAQRSLPLLVGMALFEQFNAAAWLLVLLFTLIGIRWILLHQLIDLPRDERSQVSTFTLERGAGRSLWLIKRVVFPLEIVCLLTWLFLIGKQHPVVWLMVPAYGVCVLVRLALWQGIGPAFNWTAYWLHPLGDFYEIFWPLFVALILATREPVYFVLLVFQLLWQAPYLFPQLMLLRRLLRLRIEKGGNDLITKGTRNA
jgi:4-hydroxybenzoate polyprenyltransferase